MKLVFLLAARVFYDRKRGRPAHYVAGSVLGVGLSLVPLIVVLVVSDGMIEGITNRFLEIGTYHLQVRPWKNPGHERLSDLADAIRGIEGVRETFVEQQGVALFHANGRRFGVTVRAVPAELYTTDEGFRSYFSLLSGEFDLAARNGVLVGGGIAERLDVKVGDRIMVLAAAARGGGSRNVTITPLTVQGVFSTGYQELDLLWAYVSAEVGQRVFEEGAADYTIAVKVEDPYGDLSPIVGAIRSALPDRADINTWRELQFNRYRTYKTTKLLLIFIMALIVLVAAVNISSSMVMIVLERGEEIGILKSMGMPASKIEVGFLLCGLAIGGLGSALGLGLGLLVAVNINEIITGFEAIANVCINGVFTLLAPFLDTDRRSSVEFFDAAYYLERIPVHLGYLQIFCVSGVTSALAAAASYLPAKRAGRLKPLDVIRKY